MSADPLRYEETHERVSILVREPFGSLLRAEPNLHEVIGLAKSRGAVFSALREQVRFIRRLRQARYDLVNDLYVWGDGSRLVRENIDEAADNGISNVAVVGPHWVVCAQVQAALGNAVRVGCETDIGDDFDGWYPRSAWRNAPVILYVSDDRFAVDLGARFPDRTVQSVSRTAIRRAGVLIRTIRVTRLGRMGAG